jgi:hypothetical protein
VREELGLAIGGRLHHRGKHAQDHLAVAQHQRHEDRGAPTLQRPARLVVAVVVAAGPRAAEITGEAELAQRLLDQRSRAGVEGGGLIGGRLRRFRHGTHKIP